MNLIELDRALRQLRLSGMANTLQTRLTQAQAEPPAPARSTAGAQDQAGAVSGSRQDARRLRLRLQQEDEPQSRLRSRHRSLRPAPRGRAVSGPPGTGKSHLAQAIGVAAIQQGYRVLHREAHVLLEEIAEATVDGIRKEWIAELATVPLLIIDDLGMRKLPQTAAEDLLELIMRRYERASTIITSNRPVDDWGKLLGDVAAVAALLDRLLHHAHLLKCGPKSWRTKLNSGLRTEERDE